VIYLRFLRVRENQVERLRAWIRELARRARRPWKAAPAKERNTRSPTSSIARLVLFSFTPLRSLIPRGRGRRSGPLSCPSILSMARSCAQSCPVGWMLSCSC